MVGRTAGMRAMTQQCLIALSSSLSKARVCSSNDKNDAGGRTKWGVTEKELQLYKSLTGELSGVAIEICPETERLPSSAELLEI